MAVHHVEAPEQVVTPGEELWVKIIDIDLDRRRISLSIKQAAEGGEVAAEYREHFGEHAYDEQGNYIGPTYDETDEAGEAAEGAAETAGAPEAAGAAEASAEASTADADADADPGAEPDAGSAGDDAPEAPGA
jgi:small subunit ribosomal protein S1